jgi:GNAT superfamily N-acetyltransferase
MDFDPRATVRLRGALPGEAALLSALALRSKAHWGYAPEFIDACRDELTYAAEDIARGGFVVAEVDGGIVGFYALEPSAPAEVELDALFVDPAAIGRGIGRALIEDAKTRAVRIGAQRMTIQGDPHAARFYVAAGALACGSRPSGSIPGRALPLFSIEFARNRPD